VVPAAHQPDSVTDHEQNIRRAPVSKSSSWVDDSLISPFDMEHLDTPGLLLGYVGRYPEKHWNYVLC
jgi:hypothetical protein